MKELDINTSWVKPFLLGFVVCLGMFAGIWTSKNYKALANAMMYPEVVNELKVEKQFEVKK